MEEFDKWLESLMKYAREIETEKDILAKDFRNISEFVIHGMNEIHQCRSMITPYFEYFYPKSEESEKENILKEIFKPEIDTVITSVDEIMKLMESSGDLTMKALHDLERLHSIEKDVGKILDYIQTIAGENGLLSNNSGMAIPESDNAQEMINNFDSLKADYEYFTMNFKKGYAEFKSLMKWIQTIHGRYLYNIKYRYENIYQDINSQLQNSSKKFESVFSDFESMKTNITGIVSLLQNEDILRQNLEKIIYIAEALSLKKNEFYSEHYKNNPSINLESTITFIINEKTNSSNGILKSFHEEFDAYYTAIIVLFDKSLNMVNGSEFSAIKNKLKYTESIKEYITLQKKFASHLKKVILMWKNLYEQYHAQLRYKVIMSDLLNRMRSLALQIKKNIAPDIDKNPRHRDEFAELIPEINKHLASIDAMNSSLEILNGQYHEKFMKQEEMLQNLIFSVNKHILACFESLKYKRSLLKEITAMLDKTKEYLYNGGLALLTIAAIKVFGDSCEDIESGVSIPSDDEKINSIEYFREYILLIKEHFLKRAESDDYKTKMIISFLSEFSAHQKEGIQFF